MRTAFILAGLATTLVALNPQAEGEKALNTPENSSLHVPQRASSPMVRVGDEDTTHSPNTDTTTHVDNGGQRPEVVTDSKDPAAAESSADDKSSSKDKDAAKDKSSSEDKDDDKHAPADKEDSSLPEMVNKLLPGLGGLLFPSSSSSSAVPSPTMGAAAAASASGKLYHFDDEKASQQQKRAVAPAPAPAVTERVGIDADAVIYRTVTRTETDCACASSVNGVLAKETGLGANEASAAPAPVHSSNAVATATATERVVAMPSGVDPLAARPTGAAGPSVHAVLSEESAIPSAAHGARTEVTSGSVLVHSVSTPAMRSQTRTVVASATPTAGVSHSAFVGEVATSSGTAVPTGVDPQRNGKDEQLFTGGAAWTAPREMVVMGVTGLLAAMMML